MAATGSLLVAVFAAGAAPARTRGYYVSASAADGGQGTMEQPWTLAAAFAGGGGRLRPGDTVWLREGIYRGSFRTELAGAPGELIVFRQFPGEHATIDGTLRADGSYLAFWGFEIMQSTPITYGLQANTAHGLFVNLVVHDAGTQGVSFWAPAVDAELYGCIVYNNGRHENLDHGVYVHNEVGTKLIADNVFFNNLAVGIHIYASRQNPVIRNIRVEGNVSFGNGTISNSGRAQENLIVNAPVPTEGVAAIGNFLYYAGTDGVNLRVGNYASQYNRDIVLRDNYAVGGKVGLEMLKPWQHATVMGNAFIGSRDMVRVGGASLAGHYRWMSNMWARDAGARAWRYEGKALDWLEWREATGLGVGDQVMPELPLQTRVFIRPNKYESGRAHIVVYNWGGQSEVAVDVAGVLRLDDRYEVRNVQALSGSPVVSGVYAGGPIRLPMHGVAPPLPIGRVTRLPPHTGPRFDVFLLTTRSR